MPIALTKVWTGANPIGMAVGKTGSGGRRLLVYRDGAGLFYTDDLVFLTGWVASTGVPVKTIKQPIKISWPNRGNPQTVAISLPGTSTDGGGVYISRNRGQSFTLVWATAIDRWSGFVVGFSGTPVFAVNDAGELRRFSWNGSAWVSETIVNIPRASALAVDTQNRMYVFQEATANGVNRILRVDDMTQTGTGLLFRSITSSFDLGADTSGDHFIRMNALASDADFVFTAAFGQSLIVGELIDVGGGGDPGGVIRRIGVADQAAANEQSIRTVSGSNDRLIFVSDASLAGELAQVQKPLPPDPPPVIGNANWLDNSDIMPTFKIKVQFDSTNANQNATRILNDASVSGTDVAGEVDFGSTMPGGWDAFRCVIPMAEYLTPDGQKAYRYGSVVTVRIANTGAASPRGGGQQPGAGSLVYQGMLKSPTPHADGTVLLEAVGWKILAEERDEDLLYVDESYASWQPTDGEPYGGGFETGGTINADVGKGAIKFSVDKQELIKIGHINRVGWYFEDHHPKRLQFTITQETSAPSFDILLEKFVGPTGVGTGQIIRNDLNTGATAPGGRDFDIDITTAQRPVITLGVKSTTDRGETNTAPKQKFRITNVRVFELAASYHVNALQCLRALNDPSKVADPLDMFIGSTNVSGALISDVTKNGAPLPGFMPLWWQDGSWWDLMLHLATAHAFKVALWEADGGDLGSPKLEFRPWTLNGVKTGTLHNVYGWDSTRAHAQVDLRPSDDVYSRVDVSFSLKGSQRIRHAKAPVIPNPFVGLPKNRKRVLRYHLEDPQPSRDLAEQIAAILADDLSEEQFSGTVTTSYVWSEDNNEKRNVSLVRSGDHVRVLDWPFGPRSFRVYGTRVTETEGTLQIGRTPIRVDQLVAQAHRKLMASGRVSSNPA